MKQSLILFFLFIGFLGRSQDIEFGVMLGTTHYLGDLTETPIKLKETKFGGGLIFRYYFNPHLDLKANIVYGDIAGADSLKPGSYNPVNHSVSSKWAKFRHLSFQSYIFDASCQIEYNILPYVAGNSKRNWSPYILTGISVYSFNPRAKYEGKWYDLQPLGTEGQGTTSPNAKSKYKLTQLSIPYGVGIKYSFKEGKGKKFDLYGWGVGLEVSARKTFTDHLDDVGGYYPDYKILRAARGSDGAIAVALSDRQGEVLGPLTLPGDAVPGRDPGTVRGNPDKNDQYMWIGFSITKTFRKKACVQF